MGPFKILFFGDYYKKTLLEGINWQGKNHELLTTQEKDRALDLVSSAKPKIILIDFDQPDFKPLIFIDQLLEKANGSAIIGLTEKGSLDIVVQSIKMGIHDVINTKEDLFKLHQELSRIIDKEIGYQKGEELHLKQKEKFDLHNIIGESREIKNIFRMITRIVQRKWITVLLLGETGTGKELVARAIHYKSSNQYQPFVEINCNTLPENLLESELFGHERGAFTDAKTQKKGLFELANNGTLFLDEIGEISSVIQLKLLKAIEENKIRRLGGTQDIQVNSRIISATNKDLQAAIKEKVFRSDLYYRLNVISINLPPLRERGDDVILLAHKFLNDYSGEYGSSFRSFTPEAEVLLKYYDWPGNVRELKHTIERIVLLSEGKKVDKNILEEAIKSEIPLRMSGEKPVLSLKIDIPPEGISLDEGEKLLIQAILEKTGWNKRRTARILNISRPRLDRKIKKYNLTQLRADNMSHSIS